MSSYASAVSKIKNFKSWPQFQPNWAPIRPYTVAHSSTSSAFRCVVEPHIAVVGTWLSKVLQSAKDLCICLHFCSLPLLVLSPGDCPDIVVLIDLSVNQKRLLSWLCC